MRLSDITGRDRPVPEDVEAELEAIDRALRGEATAGDETHADLVRDLRAERPEPEQGFGAELDRWAGAGFPRGARPGAQGASRAATDRARAALGSFAPRRLSYAAGALATLVVLVVAVSQAEFGASGGEPTGTVAVEDGSGGADPAVSSVPEQAPPVAGRPAAGGSDASAVAPDSARLDDVAIQGRGFNAGGQGVARGVEKRRVERDAQLTLTAPADEVQGVTNEAIGVVERNRGVVLRSQTSGTADQASATLELMVPTRLLDTTLDQLSDLADVQQMSEGSIDITRPFIDARERLANLRAERRGIRSQIEAATTGEELDALRARLDRVQRQIARADAAFENVQRRARQSSVFLQITSEGASEGDWSIGDALDDAGRVLTVAAGIALISGAVLLPLALIAGLAYAITSTARRRSRERTLDE